MLVDFLLCFGYYKDVIIVFEKYIDVVIKNFDVVVLICEFYIFICWNFKCEWMLFEFEKVYFDNMKVKLIYVKFLMSKF